MLDEAVHQTDVTHAVTGSGEVAPQPTPRPDKKLLDSYSEWLFHERRLLCMEMYPDAKNPEEFVPVGTGARAFHFSGNWAAKPQPSTRAAHVLDAVGCDWVNRGRRQPTTRDPVFELIAAERATYCALQRIWDEWDAVEGEPLPDKKRRESEASQVSADARDAVYAAQPTTSAGLLAMLQLFYERNIDGNIDEIDSDTQAMFARVRTFLSRQMSDERKAARPVTARPDPINALFSDWIRNHEVLRDTLVESDEDDDPNSLLSRITNRLNTIEADVIALPASPMRAAAIGLFELAADTHQDETLRSLDRGAGSPTWLAGQMICDARPHLTGRIGEFVSDLCDNPGRPFRDSKLHRLWTTPERAAELCERQREPMLQAAE